MSHADFQRALSYIEQDITQKQVLGGNKVIPPKERLALTIKKAVARTYCSHAQNCFDHGYVFLIARALAHVRMGQTTSTSLQHSEHSREQKKC